MNKLSTITLLCILLAAAVSCGKVEQTSKDKEYSSEWKTSEGWALRKAPGSNVYERFFAMGLWNAPGYMDYSPEYSTDSGNRAAMGRFLAASNVYNMAYQRCGNDQTDHGRIEVVGSMPFFDVLDALQKSLPCAKDNPFWDYSARTWIRNNINDSIVTKAISFVVDSIIQAEGDMDYIWAPIDEIAQGGASDWTWYPQMGEKIYQTIKSRQPNTLVFTDLLGSPHGNSYLFVKQYLETHDSLPAMPPFDGMDLSEFKGRELLALSKDYRGNQIFSESIDGVGNLKQFSTEEIRDLVFNTVKICASDFQHCGDVYSINAFTDATVDPAIPSIAVDAIKAGISPDTPVWMWFDGNGYSNAGDITTEDFVKNVRCQIYTAIIHGATGIFFWNDMTKPDDIFNGINGVVEEVKNNVSLIEEPTEGWEATGEIHYMIKDSGNGKKTIIAANTSKSNEGILKVHGSEIHTLAPLEVYIDDFKAE